MVDRDRWAPDIERVPTIAQLIQEHRDHTGDSFRAMAERAERHGAHIKHQTIAELSRIPPKQWPKSPESITALALALGVHERTVVISFAKSLGIDVEGREMFEAALPREFYLLPRTHQVRILRLVEDFMRMLIDEREAEHPVSRDDVALAAYEPEQPPRRRPRGGRRA